MEDMKRLINERAKLIDISNMLRCIQTSFFHYQLGSLIQTVKSRVYLIIKPDTPPPRTFAFGLHRAQARNSDSWIQSRFLLHFAVRPERSHLVTGESAGDLQRAMGQVGQVGPGAGPAAGSGNPPSRSQLPPHPRPRRSCHSSTQ